MMPGLTIYVLVSDFRGPLRWEKIITMLLSRHPSHGAPLRLFELDRLLTFSRNIKEQWEWHAVDDVILVIPKNGVGASDIYEKLAEGENGGAYQNCSILW